MLAFFPTSRICADEAGGILMMKRREFIRGAAACVGRSPSPRSRAVIGFLKAHRRLRWYLVAAFRCGLREMD
jgi:hypothetical protein